MTEPISTHLKAQLLGLRELPQQIGLWGKLLPRHGQKPVDPPNDQGAVQEIDASALTFVQPDKDIMRGYGIVVGGGAAVCFSLGMLPLLAVGYENAESHEVFHVILAGLLLAVICGGFGAWAYCSARAILSSPVILSRTLRKFYIWTNKKVGWQVFDYDQLYPFTQTLQITTPAGSGTHYVLSFAELEEGTRRIKRKFFIDSRYNGFDPPGQLWEFIRRYMDGPPEQVPAVAYRPSVMDRQATLARLDREHFEVVIDENHRIARGIFAPIYFWFHAIVQGWMLIATAWVQRNAPRPALPPELAQALQDRSPNPYRIIPPTDIQRAAYEGRLPHLKRRWMIALAAGAVLHGFLFGGLIAMGWLTS